VGIPHTPAHKNQVIHLALSAGGNDNNQTVIVILARIINRQGHACPNPSTTTTFNNNVEAMALGRINDRIVIVDMECGAGLDYQADMADLLHPNAMGYSKMADYWYGEGLLAVLPWADAGEGQRVGERTVVLLDGSGSTDPDGVSLQYLWEQLPQGTPVTLSDSTAQQPTFTAPEVGSGGERLAFQLTVTDSDGFTNSDTVNIDIDNVLIPPVADAGLDQEVTERDTVILNGSKSHDPDGSIASVQWEQVEGNVQVSLGTPNLLSTVFTAPAVGAGGAVLTFKLTIMDNEGLVSEDSLDVTINPVPFTGVGGESGGGSCFIQTATD
jgi:hypothetical protein